MQSPLFFIVGAERSGTTLIRLMLDHHPAVSVHHEFDFAVERLGDDGSYPEIDGYRGFLRSHPSFLRSGLIIDPDLGFRELVDGFLTQHSDGKPRIGMVVHHQFHRLLHLWPNARFVHVLRDPRDVAASCVAMGWAGNPWAGVSRWIEAERSWAHLVDRTAAENRLDVRYEELVLHPERVLRRVCEFLGEPYSVAMLTYSDDTTYEAPNRDSVERWRVNLSRRDVRRVEARIDEAGIRMHHPSCGLPRARVGSLERLWLAVHDRLGRSRFRLRRYGAALALADSVVRRTGWKRLQARIGSRIRAIDETAIR